MPSSERTAALYIVLFVLGASLELIAMLPSLQNVVGQILGQHQVLLWLWATDANAALLWFIVPVIFCSTASLLAFRDRKRIVSPIYVQIAAFAASVFLIVGILVAVPFANQYAPTLPVSWVIWAEFSLSWLGTLIVVLIVAGLQLIVVRWFVGLEMPEALDRITYSIPHPFDLVMDAIDDTFLDSYELTVVRDDERLHLLVLNRMSVSDFGQGRYVVLAFGPNPNAENTTLLATVAFERTFYELHPSRLARAMRDTMVGELERRINEHQVLLNVGIDNAISDVAYLAALEPAHSRLKRLSLAFRDVPPSFRTMIMVTIFFMLAVFVFYLTGFEGFNFSAFIETFAIALFALTVEIGVALREEITETMRRRLGLR